MLRKIISIIVAGGEKSLHSRRRQNKTITLQNNSITEQPLIRWILKSDKEKQEIRTVTSPLDTDAEDELVSTESQSMTGDYSDVHLWTEDILFYLFTLLVF